MITTTCGFKNYMQKHYYLHHIKQFINNSTSQANYTNITPIIHYIIPNASYNQLIVYTLHTIQYNTR